MVVLSPETAARASGLLELSSFVVKIHSPKAGRGDQRDLHELMTTPAMIPSDDSGLSPER